MEKLCYCPAEGADDRFFRPTGIYIIRTVRGKTHVYYFLMVFYSSEQWNAPVFCFEIKGLLICSVISVSQKQCYDVNC